MSAKLACKADLWYNEDLIWLWSEMVEHLRPRYKIGACTMSDTIPSASGIYKITCTVTRKFYIGSAVNLRDRRRCHFKELRRNNHTNPKLQRAFNKYGSDAFAFEVLELVLPMSLTAREQYWFNKLKPFGRKGFNIVRVAGSTLGRKHTAETRKNMGKVNLGNKYWVGRKHTPESREKIGQASSLRRHTPETRAKMSVSHKGKGPSPEARKNGNARIGHTVSPATREKLRQANLGKKRKRAGGESL